ncbi:zf-U1-domain-containing protein [Athelia psychrophila]|uniref:U1 small nuclear ribonucleoprotein C n=1 Tax=Athelia psychrophila TaxID=1759441 RepID=A0A166N0L5_9AGAM|nr:zf-U1-domain-containing protein [Fibularhizoctonia sp. CBS 109695]
MPKHYCDYCDVFLTHDSTSVRKAHNSGRNHLSNVRDYYASLGHDKAQSIIDQITSAYESGGGPPPGGFGGGFGAFPPGPPPGFGMPPPGFGGPPPPGFGGPPPGFGGGEFIQFSIMSHDLTPILSQRVRLSLLVLARLLSHLMEWQRLAASRVDLLLSHQTEPLMLTCHRSLAISHPAKVRQASPVLPPGSVTGYQPIPKLGLHQQMGCREACILTD